VRRLKVDPTPRSSNGSFVSNRSKSSEAHVSIAAAHHGQYAVLPAVTDDGLVVIAVDGFHVVSEPDLVRDTLTDVLEVVQNGTVPALAVDLTSRPGEPGEPARIRTSMIARLPGARATASETSGRHTGHAGTPAQPDLVGSAWAALAARLRPLACWYGMRVITDAREAQERVRPFVPAAVSGDPVQVGGTSFLDEWLERRHSSDRPKDTTNPSPSDADTPEDRVPAPGVDAEGAA
jgi:hypothetical protein